MKGVYMRWTNESIDDFLNKNNRNIIRIENYIGCQKKILWKCLKDDYTWSCTPTHILNDNVGCPKCYGNAKLDNNEVDKKLIGRNIKRLENYQGSDVNINWQCLKCSNVWRQNPDHILNTKAGCPKCFFESIKLNTNEIVQKIAIKNISILSEFNNINDKVEFKCNLCECKWRTKLLHVIYHTGCPGCLNKKEKYIQDILNNQQIEYSYHKRLNIPQLVFVDFFIYNRNIIIEYNGKQHYEPVEYYGGKSKFVKQQARDENLRVYCKENNIKLLEIPYWIKDKEIEKTVKDFINR
jgi:hypothetical protein